MHIRKHIYFKNKEVYNYFLQQPNRSAYVESLILQDMGKGTEKVTIEDIKRLISQAEQQKECN